MPNMVTLTNLILYWSQDVTTYDYFYSALKQYSISCYTVRVQVWMHASVHRDFSQVCWSQWASITFCIEEQKENATMATETDGILH